MKNGREYAVIQNDEIISAASSYSYCECTIDITNGTKDEYRQSGLAKAVAEKLGYTFEKAYEVYMI